MGMSKALMEKLMAAKARIGGYTQFCGTRFGNVLASRGSVVPLFIKQIRDGQAITITNPDMTRFMMTMDNALDLVFHAFNLGRNGDIFVRKDATTTVLMIASALLQIFDAHNELRVIGARHGEKLYETLLTREERTRAIEYGEYFHIPLDSRDLNYSQYTEGSSKTEEEYTSHNANRMTFNETVTMLSNLDCVKEALK
jgi:UDP-glucose 4-epimerase